MRLFNRIEQTLLGMFCEGLSGQFEIQQRMIHPFTITVGPWCGLCCNEDMDTYEEDSLLNYDNFSCVNCQVEGCFHVSIQLHEKYHPNGRFRDHELSFIFYPTFQGRNPRIRDFQHMVEYFVSEFKQCKNHENCYQYNGECSNSKMNDHECSICKETNTDKITQCNHHFHNACLSRWSETKDTCPMCRRDLRY
jgi:hypothetical protein